jgi:hypothetical protein
MSKGVRMLLSRNNLTHEQLVKLSQWANPWGLTWLSTSQISYLRTGTLVKAGPRTIDALGQVNLRLAQAAGVSSPEVDDLPSFGPIPAGLVLPPEPFFLRHPQTRHPLDAGGLYLAWLGRITPEGLDDGAISDMEARRLSGNISRIIQGWARDRRLTISQAMDKLMEVYPTTEETRRQRLRMVAVGFEVFTGEALVEELPALGEVLGVVDAADCIEAGDVRERLYRLPKES